ncbi:zinc ribbon domain-containing protein [Xylella fastidiosa]|uniref:zinc ribbon domain-containing protein n=1 Tax=Xylella fastidiosa TaxID=2371 RepID=UPI003AFAB976
MSKVWLRIAIWYVPSPIWGFLNSGGSFEYKAAMRGGQVVVADRFFASSKMCSTCGHTSRNCCFRCASGRVWGAVHVMIAT